MGEKVYIIIGGDVETRLYDGIEGVYATEEDAIRAASSLAKDHGGNKVEPPDFAVAAFQTEEESEEEWDHYSSYWLLVLERDVENGDDSDVVRLREERDEALELLWELLRRVPQGKAPRAVVEAASMLLGATYCSQSRKWIRLSDKQLRELAGERDDD